MDYEAELPPFTQLFLVCLNSSNVGSHSDLAPDRRGGDWHRRFMSASLVEQTQKEGRQERLQGSRRP